MGCPGPSGWDLSFPVRFEEWWSRCWESVLLSWLKAVYGEIPQMLNIVIMLRSMMGATTATAEHRENKNFNCVRILGNQFYYKYFHKQLNNCNRTLPEMTLQRCLQGACVLLAGEGRADSQGHCSPERAQPPRQAEWGSLLDPPSQSYMTKQTLLLSKPHFPTCKMKMITPQLGFYENKHEEQGKCLPQTQAHLGPLHTVISLPPMSSRLALQSIRAPAHSRLITASYWNICFQADGLEPQTSKGKPNPRQNESSPPGSQQRWISLCLWPYQLETQFRACSVVGRVLRMLLPPGKALHEEKRSEGPAGTENSWRQAPGGQEGWVWWSWLAPYDSGALEGFVVEM